MITPIDLKGKGLSNAEAARKLKKEGFNELPSAGPKSFLTILLEVLKQPMFLLLLASAILYLFLGDLREGLVLMFAVLMVIAITFYQEKKTERALDALRKLSSPRALVIRNGEEKRIPGREIVREDVIVVAEGERVPADARIIATRHLSVDESMLTGESVPVSKFSPKDDESEREEHFHRIFSGTMVVSGQAIAEVFATGNQTELGKIGRSLKSIEQEEPLLQKEVKKMVRVIATIAVGLCLLSVLAFGIINHNWLKGILSGLTLAMAILPEEFPVVLTIFFALGAWRIAKKNVLTRKVASIETLGAATILCSDKTGTITQNKMLVQALFAKKKIWYADNKELPEAYHELMEYAILASHKNPFDPMEKAIWQCGKKYLKGTEHLHEDRQPVKEYPLSSELLSMAEAWEGRKTDKLVIAAKGAPEAIFELCHLTKEKTTELEDKVVEMASNGLRVIGVACSEALKTRLPEDQHDFDFRFVGLVGLADPVRKDVPAAIKEAYEAGIKVMMITGDYAATAKNIAKEAGIHDYEAILSGEELAALNDEELFKAIDHVYVFSRVVPEQKLRIVQALKERGEIVAMTGDGVNDAPALKAAHIGIAMGQKGTDVAREASDLVLLEDDFGSIVAAVRMGRRIFGNLQKAMSYIIAIHIPIAGLSLLPVFFQQLPMILLPVHIAFLELIIDPICSVAFEAEPEEPDVMKKPPRRLEQPLFSRRRIILNILQGLSALGIVLAVYFLTIRFGYSEQDTRTIAFCALIVVNISLILTNRSWVHSVFSRNGVRNKTLLYLLLGIVAFFLLVLYVPAFRTVFHFSTLHIDDLLISLFAGLLSILWFELLKLTGLMKKA